MSAYFDTSALVKRYFQEVGSDDILEIWDAQGVISISAVAYAEALAAFWRKRRDGDASATDFRRILRAFKRDWEYLDVLDVSAELNDRVERILRAHPIRGFDAIHLASALAVRDAVGEDFLFVCADRRLLDAARREGLNVYPEQSW